MVNPGIKKPDANEATATDRKDDENAPVTSFEEVDKMATILDEKRRDSFVQLMRFMPHGLVVVFAGGELGMLVSSFTSVAVSPRPYISFNVKLPSSTYERIRKSKMFAVVSVRNAMFADAFTKHSEDRNILFENLMSQETKSSIHPTRHRLVEDHVIVVGKVIDLGSCNKADERRPLVYFDGRYHLLGDSVTPEGDASLIPDSLIRK